MAKKAKKATIVADIRSDTEVTASKDRTIKKWLKTNTPDNFEIISKKRWRYTAIIPETIVPEYVEELKTGVWSGATVQKVQVFLSE